MKKSIFAICDLEASYARNLTEYMNERRNTPFEVQAFTNVESLKAFAGENHIDLLLISPDAMCEEIRKLDVERIIMLSNGEPLGNLEEPCIYKYQPSDCLLAEVMNYYARTSPQLQPSALPDTGMNIIGIYSPLGRVGKTSLALVMGEILGEREKVLYLNLEDYNGFEALFLQNYPSDISDLIYFARQKEGNLIYKLNGMIQTFHHLDYIPPAFLPGDLENVRYEEWVDFLGKTAGNTEYDTLILDFGHQIDETFQLLRYCRRIYMPVLDDVISRAKLFQFEKNVSVLECTDILKKTVQIQLPEWKLPENGRDWLAVLVKGKLGQYVRRLLDGEGQEERSAAEFPEESAGGFRGNRYDG